MNRKFAQKVTFGLTALMAGSAAAAQERPNVIVILCDDMGYSDLGCFGSPEIETPNLDRLAEQGVRFSQFYNTPRSCPSRACLLTGLYPHEAGIGHMVYKEAGPGYEGNLNLNGVTMGEAMKTAGYETLYVGKWHAGHSSFDARPEVRGYDKFTGIYTHIDAYWSVLKGCEIYRDKEILIDSEHDEVNPYDPSKEFYTTDFFTDVAIDYIGQYKEEKSGNPFYMHLCYNAPHFPLEAPDSLIQKYIPKYAKGWDNLKVAKMKKMRELGLLKKHQQMPDQRMVIENKSYGRNYAVLEKGAAVPIWRDLDKETQEELIFRRAIYAAQIDFMDHSIGRLVDYLEKEGLRDNTVIMFMSDNGCSAEVGDYGCFFEENRKSNYQEWKKKGGWSASQGACWAGYSDLPFREYKQFTNEGGISSAFIVSWPDGIKNTGRLETEQVGHLIDIMPTVLDLADADYPKEYNGRKIHPARGMSLLPTLQGKAGKVTPRELYWHHQNNAAIRLGDWKLVTNNDRNDAEWELYNLKDDRSEMDNVINSYPKIAKKLKAKWFKWAHEVNAIPYIEERELHDCTWPAPAWPEELK